MTFMNQIKAANVVSSLILLGGLVASVYNLPQPWAIDMLKMLVMGAAGWLMVKEATSTTTTTAATGSTTTTTATPTSNPIVPSEPTATPTK